MCNTASYNTPQYKVDDFQTMASKNNKRQRKTKQWAQRHINDPFVKKATGQGYRSRAVFKLEEIDQQDKLIKPEMLIADLGSAPGGWSQYIARKKVRNKVVAIDLLKMESIQGVDFVQGDFTEDDFVQQMLSYTNNKQFDLVISDMAPNITGIRDVDDARYENILDATLAFCNENLKKGGCLLVKLFEGHAANRHRKMTKAMFEKNQVRKPLASRSNSKELYYLSIKKM